AAPTAFIRLPSGTSRRLCRGTIMRTMNRRKVMKSARFIAFITVAALVAAVPLQAQVKVSDTETTKLFINLNTVGTLQALSQRNVFDSTSGKSVGNTEAGMQTAYGDLGFLGYFGKKQE